MSFNNQFTGVNTVIQNAAAASSDQGDKVVPATIKLSEQQKTLYSSIATSEGIGLSTWGREALSFASLFKPDIRAKIRRNAQLIAMLASEMK